MTDDPQPPRDQAPNLAAPAATDAGPTNAPSVDATIHPTTDAHPPSPDRGKEEDPMLLRPAPGRDLRNRPATRRGQASDLGADHRWARIAVREQRRATFWRALLDQYIESLEREASERKEKGHESGN